MLRPTKIHPLILVERGHSRNRFPYVRAPPRRLERASSAAPTASCFDELDKLVEELKRKEKAQ
jgi:hypothetical protein